MENNKIKKKEKKEKKKRTFNEQIWLGWGAEVEDKSAGRVIGT
jgi:hypothetical protein